MTEGGVSDSMSRCVLAGDVGGTKTTLAIYPPGGVPRSPTSVETFPSRDFASFDELVRPFLTSVGEPPLGRVSLGVAGPVVDNRAQLTNLPWELDGDDLARRLGSGPATLLNDVEALAHAVPELDRANLEEIHPGSGEDGGTRAVVAAGTGLGMASLVRAGGSWIAVESEGSHSSFSPADEEQVDLLRFLWRELDHVSFERVCSGDLGVPNLVRFLREGRGIHPTAEVAEALEGADDWAPVVFDSARDGRCRMCVSAVDLFIRMLGSAAGNLALTVLATGGVYLGGGIPPRIVDRIRTPEFRESFTGKGRFTGLLSRIPVRVITDGRAAVWGAASHALRG